MRNSFLTILAIVLFVFTINGTAFAELTSADWKITGDNNITHDSVTDLEWLDISVTLGISTDEMLTELLPGGRFCDFRYATISELKKLTANFGIVYCSSSGFTTKANADRVKKMHTLFGGRHYDSGYSGSFWYTYTVYGYTVSVLTNEVYRQEYGWKYKESRPPAYTYTTTAGGLNLGEGNFQCSLTGHFIVKDTDTVVEPTEVIIDIKPGGCPNPLNVTDQGDFPIAVLGTEDFDITDIDLASVRLEGVAPTRSSIEDVSAPINVMMCIDHGYDEDYYDYEYVDGYDDLSLKFTTQDIVAAIGDVVDGAIVELTLTVTLVSGTEIEGSNFVLIINN